MLKSTFLHLKGIGKKSEQALWQNGILTWDDYQETKAREARVQEAKAREARVQEAKARGTRAQEAKARGARVQQAKAPETTAAALRETLEAHSKEDMLFFSRHLKPAEYFRVALSYPEETVFLRVEATGSSLYYDHLTMLGWSIGNRYGVYLRGNDDQHFRKVLDEAKVLVTFNGTLCDLKFLNKTFLGLAMPAIHLDLRYFVRRLGLTGGQRKIEHQLGFSRPLRLERGLGEAAPVLWQQYRRGNKQALKKLVKHNHAAVEGMKAFQIMPLKWFTGEKTFPALSG